MKITVTQDDIDNGSTHICTLDPITHAMRRAVGLQPAVFTAEQKLDKKGNPVAPTHVSATRFEAFTQPSRIYANGKLGMIRCEAPAVVREAILKWDETGEMEPFEFEVPLATDTNVSYGWLFPGVRPM